MLLTLLLLMHLPLQTQNDSCFTESRLKTKHAVYRLIPCLTTRRRPLHSTCLFRLFLKLPQHYVWDCAYISSLLDCSELACTTSSGPDSNKSCIFPFEFRGITYNCCTKDGNEDPSADAWCSTKVDESGKDYEHKLSKDL